MGRRGKGKKGKSTQLYPPDLDADQDTGGTKKTDSRLSQDGTATSSDEPLTYKGTDTETGYVRWKDIKFLGWLVPLVISIIAAVYYVVEYKTRVDVSLENAEVDIKNLKQKTNHLNENSIRHESRLENLEEDVSELKNFTNKNKGGR